MNTVIEKKEYPLSELTGRIIGCAMDVHRIMGNGFQEVIYQRCLVIEMTKQGLRFSREHEMELYYKQEHVGQKGLIFL